MEYLKQLGDIEARDWFTAPCSAGHPSCSYEPDGLCVEQARERSDYLRARIQKAREAADTVAEFTDGRDVEAFVHGMSRQHRTLQQYFTKLCLAWFRHLASLAPGQYDGRNEDSVILARKLQAAGLLPPGLPTV
jgi:hypothetical protein